ncbi:IS982 family transposase [Thiotrichales bacterium HSG14]|nr:IS982 family transposase [Thiotrichales bacterium HSG14]
MYRLLYLFNKKSYSQENSIYVIDSFPVPVCDNIRIPNSKIYKDEEFRGYNASKRCYFYGLKVHLAVTQDGEPIEFFLTQGAVSDTRALEGYVFDLPEGSTIYGDKAYNYYEIEDFLKEIDSINLQPIRKKNTKRPLKPWFDIVQKLHRKMIETTNSLITKLFPKKIHAVIDNSK